MRDDPNGSIDPHRRTQNKKPCRSQWPMLRRRIRHRTPPRPSYAKPVRAPKHLLWKSFSAYGGQGRGCKSIFLIKSFKTFRAAGPRGKATGTARGRRKCRRPPPFRSSASDEIYRLFKATDALLRIKLQSMDNDTNFSWIPPVRKKADSISIFMDSAAASFSPVHQSSFIPSPPVPGPPHERAAISGPPCGRHKMSKLPHKACTASGKA